MREKCTRERHHSPSPFPLIISPLFPSSISLSFPFNSLSIPPFSPSPINILIIGEHFEQKHTGVSIPSLSAPSPSGMSLSLSPLPSPFTLKLSIYPLPTLPIPCAFTRASCAYRTRGCVLHGECDANARSHSHLPFSIISIFPYLLSLYSLLPSSSINIIN
jgi:hypothetical protein